MKKIDLVDRAKNMILAPKQEWELIEREQYEVKDLYTDYVMILAAIPAVAYFIGFSIVPLGGILSKYGTPIPSGIAHMVLDYLFGLGSVYVLALIIDALAPTFEGEKNMLQAMKLAVFSSTAACSPAFSSSCRRSPSSTCSRSTASTCSTWGCRSS